MGVRINSIPCWRGLSLLLGIDEGEIETAVAAQSKPLAVPAVANRHLLALLLAATARHAAARRVTFRVARRSTALAVASAVATASATASAVASSARGSDRLQMTDDALNERLSVSLSTRRSEGGQGGELLRG